MEGLEYVISSAICDWEQCDLHSHKQINKYIEQYENVFVTFGLFQRGLRIKPVSSDRLIYEYHHTLDGVKGIVSLNVAILRQGKKM